MLYVDIFVYFEVPFGFVGMEFVFPSLSFLITSRVVMSRLFKLLVPLNTMSLKI